MQFTGFLDGDDNEIYSGDTVKHSEGGGLVGLNGSAGEWTIGAYFPLRRAVRIIRVKASGKFPERLASRAA